jgi:Fe-S-cluster containining protein
MKRRCPYCRGKFKGKELSSHVYEVHEGRGKEFYCRETCVRCCTDPGAPLELVLEDIERISSTLGIGCVDFFNEYGGVLWSNIPGSRSLIPSTGLPFPCKFLKQSRCSIYGVRPLHCRLFPERLFIEPSPQMFESFYEAGYQCIDEGLSVRGKRADETKKLMIKDRSELERTAGFFRNEEFIYELTPEEYRQVQQYFSGLDSKDLDRNKKRREVLERLIPAQFKENVRNAFLSRLGQIDKQSKE